MDGEDVREPGEGPIRKTRTKKKGTPAGVVHVTVGRRGDHRPAEGVREAHVARIHDLPSLIRAVVAEDETPKG